MSMSSSNPECSALPQRPLRRLMFELFGIIVLKLALLMLIWWVAFAHYAKPDSSPQAIEHLLAPTSSTPPEGHP